jgi:hypothetical protein
VNPEKSEMLSKDDKANEQKAGSDLVDTEVIQFKKVPL